MTSRTTESEGPLRVAVIGAGTRGTHLARRLTAAGNQARVVAVAELNAERRAAFAAEHGLPSDAQFASWEAFAASSLACDAAIVATMDNQHAGPAVACLRRGCHILLEKPLAHTFEDCLAVARAQEETGLVVAVCHTLRFMDAFRRVKQIVDDGALGGLIHVEHMEAVGHQRFAHNYVRGRWAKEANNAFLLLHKCCHDIDFLAWLVAAECSRVSSFGSLTYFTPANAPEGSAERCLDDCRVRDDCPYSAVRLYLDGDLTGRIQDLGGVDTREARLEAIRQGPFGACVWRAGNDVVDHQVVSMEFANGVTATCTMSGYSATHGRRTRLQGAEGELLFDEATGSITINRFGNTEEERIELRPADSYHPEDREIVGEWLTAVRSSSPESVGASAREALRTHAIVFAAELSRQERRVVEMTELSG